MSHGLNVVGSGMFSARGIVPWHNHPSCSVVQQVESISEAIKLAHCDWQAIKKPTYYKDDSGNPVETGAFSLVRSDNGYHLTEGRSVGNKYTILQNEFAFNWFQPFLDSKEASLDSAGALDGGCKIWVLAKLNKIPMEIAKDDEVEKFLMLSNSFDGTTAIRVGLTPVRIVCANTLAMAHSDNGSKLMRLRHGRDVEANLEKIRDVINAIDAEFEATAEQYKFLASRTNINQKDFEKYCKIVLEMKVDEQGNLNTRSKNTLLDLFNKYYKNACGMNQADYVAKVTEAFETNAQDVTPARFTWWAAYNSLTEYFSHERGHTVDTRLNSLFFGDSFQRNKVALETAMSMAA